MGEENYRRIKLPNAFILLKLEIENGVHILRFYLITMVYNLVVVNNYLGSLRPTKPKN